jgi:DNA-binding response OmpR family regulator
MQKILVIEDDKFLRELIVQKLLKEGYETTEAVDGEEGIQRVAKDKPDIVLLDIILPGIDGFEVLRRVRENEEIRDIPIIILSNLGQQDDVEKGMELGAKDYLVKAEFTPTEIVEKIRATIG